MKLGNMKISAVFVRHFLDYVTLCPELRKNLLRTSVITRNEESENIYDGCPESNAPYFFSVDTYS
jgi:hypothetical protein